MCDDAMSLRNSGSLPRRNAKIDIGTIGRMSESNNQIGIRFARYTPDLISVGAPRSGATSGQPYDGGGSARPARMDRHS
jgi:hypothetical protein